VHKTYLLGLEGVPALRGVNLTVMDGEFITILGTSGGGKTTMLNIIGTIDKPSKGDVYICGLRIKYSTADQLLASIRLNKLGFVF
jgi:putative ABC transport system ATP-binding protein